LSQVDRNADVLLTTFIFSFWFRGMKKQRI
jgi:hypothetical protein